MIAEAIDYSPPVYIENMSPVQLTIMAYDGVIKDLRQAKSYWLDRSEYQALQRNQHAQDLITELLMGLDYERGGDIARNLSRLYDFALRQLVGIGSESDILIYDHLINIFGDLREAWVQIGTQQC
ncbi:MAG: flagellar export chaperone FliS [Syntrophobacteraceae bacterium]